jgi:hypothetical protein
MAGIERLADLGENIEDKLDKLYKERNSILAELESCLEFTNGVKHSPLYGLGKLFTQEFNSPAVYDNHIKLLDHLVTLLNALKVYDSLIIFLEVGYEAGENILKVQEDELPEIDIE